MAFDFTLHKYRELLEQFIAKGYTLMAYEDLFTTQVPDKYVIVRHDVDDLPLQSLKKAEIEKELGVRSTYYFRIVEESNKPEIIRAIAALGHEIGFHYEDLSLANGNFRKAVRLFEKNLAYFRTYYPVKTICMHGSPTSIWDNRMIWKEIKYRDYGIIAEPYFDTDFTSTLYITDTGRRWDGNLVSVRDKVKNSFQSSFRFRNTNDILRKLKSNELPSKVMITTHPQRWSNEMGPWIKELIFQNIKNFIKKNFYVQSPLMD